MTESAERPPGAPLTPDEFKRAFTRIRTLLPDVMSSSDGDTTSVALSDLKSDVDMLLAIPHALPLTYVSAHTLGVACRQIALRVDEPKYAETAIALLSSAVDLSFHALPTTGDLEEFLLCLVTYLKCAASFAIADRTLPRVEPMLRFASRAAGFRASPHAYACWAHLAHLLTFDARVDGFRSDRERLLRARAALARAEEYRPSGPDEESALLITSSEVVAMLIDVGLESDPAKAAARLEMVLERRAALDLAFQQLGRPPDQWRAFLLHRITSACPDPGRVLGVWAARWLMIDDWIDPTLARLDAGVINRIPDLVTTDPPWVGRAWVLVIVYLDPLLKRAALELPKSVLTREDGYTIDQVAGLTQALMTVYGDVARRADVDVGCVLAANSLIGRTSMSQGRLEELSELTLDEHEQAVVMDSLGITPEGWRPESVPDTRRESADELLRRSAALRDRYGTDAEITAFLWEVATEVVQDPLAPHVSRLIPEAVAMTAALEPGLTRMRGVIALAWTALNAPAAWAERASDELRALVISAGRSWPHPDELAGADVRRVAYDFVVFSEAFESGSIPDERVLDTLRSCLRDAGMVPDLLEQANGLIDIAVRAGDGRLRGVLEFETALSAWQAAKREDAVALRSEAALLFIRVWAFTRTSPVPTDAGGARSGGPAVPG